ncbi:recombinase family protein [Actinomadura sp. 6N118]|uniref:recombinase family protein n=1 Tax=Actinomadura sp. 6N118 TaxID=3375151 RepID=UPI0037A09268
MTVWAYARVSTRDQNPQLQLDALEASGYDELVTEKESGKRGVDRPEWEALITRPVDGDTLKFWKSDRWGRSAGHVLTTVNELRDRGVKVVSLTENFDLDTKEGRFMFAVLAAAAEYENELRAERQAEGIAAAQRRQAEGAMLQGKKHIGRPRSIGPAELDELRRMVNEDGKSVTEAARTLKIGRSTAYAALAGNATAPVTQPAAAAAVHGPDLDEVDADEVDRDELFDAVEDVADWAGKNLSGGLAVLNPPLDRLAEAFARATGDGPLKELLTAAAAVCAAAPAQVPLPSLADALERLRAVIPAKTLRQGG